MKRIALVDDHPLFTQTMCMFLKTECSEVEVMVFNDPIDFCRQYPEKAIDLILLDLEMPGKSGIEVIREIRLINSTQAIIVLSMFYNLQIAIELRKLGVMAFLPKNCDIDELQMAMRAAEAQKFYYGKLDVTLGEKYKADKILVTRRELEIIKLSAEGSTAKQISHTLCIAEGTVKTHIKNIINKTKLVNLKEVIAQYQSHGWNVLV
ncbi:MAG: response regulator transcription factor [Reichenbachiella sp.]